MMQLVCHRCGAPLPAQGGAPACPICHPAARWRGRGDADAEPRAGDRHTPSVARRHEGSVLFDLASLTALGRAERKAPVLAGAGSGLISLAALRPAVGRGAVAEEPLAEEPLAVAPIAVLAAQPPRRSWPLALTLAGLVIGLAAASLALAAALRAGPSIMRASRAAPQRPPAAREPTAVRGLVTLDSPPTRRQPRGANTTSAARGGKTTGNRPAQHPPALPSRRPTARRHSGHRPVSRRSPPPGSSAPTSTTPAPTAAAPVPTAVASRPDDPLAGLVEQALKRAPGPTPPAPSPPPGQRRPRTLERHHLQTGISAQDAAVRGCARRYALDGVAELRMIIGPAGTVTAARVTSTLAGTPVAACLEQVFGRARFAAFDGPPLPVTFAVPLRPL